MRRSRARRPQGDGDGAAGAEFEPQDLSGLFAAPRWLRDLGATAWLAVGVTLFIVGAVWILALTQTIVAPVITAAVIAAVTSPVVARLQRLGVARGLGAALLLVGAIVLGVVVVLMVVGGITGEADSLRRELAAAKDTLVGWASDLGVDRGAAESAGDDASSSVNGAVPALLKGLAVGAKHLSSLVVFLGLAALSLFFLLKDGPVIRGWA